MSNNSSNEQLRKELTALGAREFEVVALIMDPDRGLAALRLALQRGAENPIPYAIKLFDSIDWQPSGEVRRQGTNLHVEKTCSHCAGDRFVLVTEGSDLYGETYAPCKFCNAKTDTKRWVGSERRETAPA